MTDPNLKTLSKILLIEANRVALEEALTALQGRAKVFPSSGDILHWAGDLEARLDAAGVAASNRVGCTYEYRGAGPSANAYKYAKAVIGFEAKRTAKGWFLTDAGNRHVHPKTPVIDKISLTPKAKESVVRAALAPFGTLHPTAA